jgi:Flp pilus assembly pilin Flp
LATSEKGETMNRISKLYVRLSEGQIATRCARLATGKGQTMTEYVLIVSAVAIAVLAGYQTAGSDLKTLVTTLTTEL